MGPEKTSCDGLPTGPKATSSASTPRCRGTLSAPRWQSCGSSRSSANCLSCARPRIQTVSREQTARAYYRPYYRRIASPKKLSTHTRLSPLAEVPRAGLEPAQSDRKPFAGQVVAVYRFAFVEFEFRLSPSGTYLFRPKPRCHGTCMAQNVDHDAFAAFGRPSVRTPRAHARRLTENGLRAGLPDCFAGPLSRAPPLRRAPTQFEVADKPR